LTIAPFTCGQVPVTIEIRAGTHSGQLVAWDRKTTDSPARASIVGEAPNGPP